MSVPRERTITPPDPALAAAGALSSIEDSPARPPHAATQKTRPTIPKFVSPVPMLRTGTTGLRLNQTLHAGIEWEKLSSVGCKGRTEPEIVNVNETAVRSIL